MRRRALIGFGIAALAAGALGAPAPALAAIDATTTTVACSPATVTTGKPTTCNAAVTDTEATPLSAPSGVVTFSSSPTTGTFSGSGHCTLAATTAARASCSLTFTPAAGGSYTLSAAYAGDTQHTGSTGSDSPTAIDSTTTTLSCAPASVPIDSSTDCTATLTDASATHAPLGTVSFAAAPNTGAFGTPGICQWQPAGSGPGGSATCHVTFTPSAPGTYTLTAAYGGDGTHNASSGSFGLTATTTPAGGGPGSHGGGGGTVSIGGSGGPPPPGKVAVGRSAKVGRGHTAKLQLSCAGAAGASCTGGLVLTTRAKVKVKVKVVVKVKHRAKKGKGKGKTTVTTKTKTRTKRVTKTILVGAVVYRLAAGHAQVVVLKLSKTAVKLLARARRGGLHTQALVDGAAVGGVSLLGPKHKHKHKHKKHKHHPKHKKHKHKK